MKNAKRFNPGAPLALAMLLGTATTGHAQGGDDLVSRGSYLAAAGGCHTCHTPTGSDKPLSGGVPIETPFGLMQSANITPDPETGIGGWTRDDFEGALRRGKRKDGLPLYPTMPYTHFTKITDEDVDALWAYVSSTKPVHNKVEVNELPPPYDIRASLIGWQLLFFDEGRFEPDPAMSEEEQRGAYLAEALAHCSSCHTPKNPLGAEETGKLYQGATVEVWHAPNISNNSQSVLSNFTTDSLAQYLATGSDGHNREAFGKMAEVVGELSHLTPEDVHAIAAYFKSLEPEEPADQPEVIVLDPPREQAGAMLFEEHCVSCHGADGAGREGVGGRLAQNGAITDGPALNIISLMLKGIEPRGEWGAMPDFADVLSDQDLADIANYVRTSWGNQATSFATADLAQALRESGVTQSEGSHPAAVVCAPVPAERMDAATRAALDKLGEPVSADALKPILDGYSERHPDLDAGDKIVSLTGAYCAGMSDRIPNSRDLIARQLAFMNTVSALVAPSAKGD